MNLEDVAVDTTVGLFGHEHDAPLSFPPGWDFANVCKRSSGWGRMGQPGLTHAEWRGAIVAERGTRPSGDWVIEISHPQYWGYTVNGWQLVYDVHMSGLGHGAYLGDYNRPLDNPFVNSKGRVLWTPVGEHRFASTWREDTPISHFWASKKQVMLPGQAAELSCGAIRVVPANPATTGNPTLLAGIGVDYYPNPQTNNNKAPGPGIQRSQRITSDWTPFAWLTPSAPTGWDNAALRQWVREYGLPNVAMAELFDTTTPPDPPPIIVVPPPEVPGRDPDHLAILDKLDELETKIDLLLLKSTTLDAELQNISETLHNPWTINKGFNQ